MVQLIKENIRYKQNRIGVVTHDDIETYASIIGIWLTGNIFVPLNPFNPINRIQQIIQQADISVVCASSELPAEWNDIHGFQLLLTNMIELSGEMPALPEVSANDFLYLLFTSGSTGVPKGVPISLLNLQSFVFSFIESGYKFSPDDRFLQIYNLSFDASVHCYAVPLAVGACVYTVPQEEIKYLYALQLMQEKELTFVKMPPSTIAYMRPFFDRIRLDKLKYCLLGGEALNHELVEEWSACIPNAIIQNVYGPTEATINCTIFNWTDAVSGKLYNGIVSIGKPFGDTKVIVADKELNIVKTGETGELCVAGSQITQGYWNDPEKNKESFFEVPDNNNIVRYYRTGDIVKVDDDGDILYCGRIDEQVQIDGFRVELGEIEKHARDLFPHHNVAVVSIENEQFTTEIHLFIEGLTIPPEEVRKYLEQHLPYYMIPAGIHPSDKFPESAGGKINKTALRKSIKK